MRSSSASVIQGCHQLQIAADRSGPFSTRPIEQAIAAALHGEVLVPETPSTALALIPPRQRIHKDEQAIDVAGIIQIAAPPLSVHSRPKEKPKLAKRTTGAVFAARHSLVAASSALNVALLAGLGFITTAAQQSAPVAPEKPFTRQLNAAQLNGGQLYTGQPNVAAESGPLDLAVLRSQAPATRMPDVRTVSGGEASTSPALMSGAGSPGWHAMVTRVAVANSGASADGAMSDIEPSDGYMTVAHVARDVIPEAPNRSSLTAAGATRGFASSLTHDGGIPADAPSVPHMVNEPTAKAMAITPTKTAPTTAPQRVGTASSAVTSGVTSVRPVSPSASNKASVPKSSAATTAVISEDKTRRQGLGAPGSAPVKSGVYSVESTRNPSTGNGTMSGSGASAASARVLGRDQEPTWAQRVLNAN
jgi:hypothetical protein